MRRNLALLPLEALFDSITNYGFNYELRITNYITNASLMLRCLNVRVSGSPKYLATFAHSLRALRSSFFALTLLFKPQCSQSWHNVHKEGLCVFIACFAFKFFTDVAFLNAMIAKDSQRSPWARAKGQKPTAKSHFFATFAGLIGHRTARLHGTEEERSLWQGNAGVGIDVGAGFDRDGDFVFRRSQGVSAGIG